VILKTSGIPSTRPLEARIRGQRGASFVELMLSVLVISTTVVGSTASLSSSTEVYHYFADGQHEALMLAQEIHEGALLLPWSEGEPGSAMFGPDVTKLDDLDERTFEPPRSAEFDVVVSHLGWSQEVEVNQVDLADPTVEVDPATFEGEMQTELKVTVMNGDTLVGTFTWWLSEPTHD
jgi:hypothetical protein